MPICTGGQSGYGSGTPRPDGDLIDPVTAFAELAHIAARLQTAHIEVYRVSPTMAFGFGKGATYRQTR